MTRSLLLHELAVSRGRSIGSAFATRRAELAWNDDTSLSADGEDELGCDSLELLQLGAAANEMFHLHEAGREADLLATCRVGDWLDRIADAWAAGVAHVTFSTSGSTGSPKRCVHSFAHLADEVDALAAQFADRRRVVTFAPPHHIYGFLFGALLPDRLGVELWAAERATAGELARGLRSGDVVVAFPERWAWLDRSLPAWPAGVTGVTSTAPCPAALIHALRQRGLDGLVEVYGSSESAGIGLRTCPHDPYTLMPQWRRASLAQDGSELVHESGRHATLPDHVAWGDDRHFRLQGRRDGAVQVGGLNVFPDRVAGVLRAMPGVVAVTVRLMRPEEGTRLKAFIVPAAEADTLELERALRAFAAKHLPVAERPTAFAFGRGIPTTALGKPGDW